MFGDNVVCGSDEFEQGVEKVMEVNSNIIFVANEKFNQDVNVDHVNLTKINSFHDMKFIDSNS
ncbi:557_t:CDS:2 [Gigaspora margarita]|uniref:557_t:CDS:1 n=1 Tax=Gigaspora margarita TaxID=4874 RepID=A0ABM8W5X6_GIGMA|nr:557_t:CDS:2 [Gigaspora margarita]